MVTYCYYQDVDYKTITKVKNIVMKTINENMGTNFILWNLLYLILSLAFNFRKRVQDSYAI